MSRRALLLAIADYDPLPALDYVANDIARMKAALARAGFEPKDIEVAGAGVGEVRARELTSTRLRGAICDFLDSADRRDEMLIFFSGHGIELDGRRVLLPQDFTPRRPEHANEMVTDSWISMYARGCKARSVVVLIDACREGVRYTLAPSKSAQLSEYDKEAPLKNEYDSDATDGPTIAFLYSCATGELSSRDRQGEDCSAFTRAFAEAIELEKGPPELEGICREGRRRLLSYGGGGQTLVESGRPGRGGPWQRLVIKEDEAARFRERLARSDWARRLAETELFAKVEATLPTFAIQLRALAMRTEERVTEARRVLPIQRWRDEGAWSRQAARIRHVFLREGEAEEVPAAEVAVLLAVPFVYEAALAAAESGLVAAGAAPDPEAASSSGYLVNAWGNAWRDSDAAQVRRALVARNKQDAADDYSCWALVEFCHASGELWDAQGGARDRTGWALDAITALVAPAPLPEITLDRRVCDILSAPRLLRLARLMFASFDDVTLDTAGGGRFLDPQVSSGEFAAQLVINEVRLAHLLNMGSQLALDPRRMPSLLAEHVGADDVLSAEWLRLQLDGAEWHVRSTGGAERIQDGRCFDLKLDCANDAVDAALLAVVDTLESYRTRLLQRQDVHAVAVRDLLPGGFTVNSLNALPSGWHPARPPLRFELDRTRIIGLLMGQQLYGERWPALRELYQNALDACRYRGAAEQLALLEGRARAGSTYEGRIVIRFGTDKDRRFVECVDDGIGMADRHIRRLFAYAGRRFTDSHEFHIDRARWDEADIKFFPNSRFGVGVLSYFMLAEELDIASRRWVSPTDLAPSPVHARIIGSGSLFRLESVVDPSRLADDYGTSVRLYLREDAPDDDTLLKSIRSWLLLPEVAVTIVPKAGPSDDLVAGQPTDTLRAATGNVLLPVPGSENTGGRPRVYIAPCINRIHGITSDANQVNQQSALVDGIITSLMGKPWPMPAIVNLTEDLRSTLTVDRRRVSPTETEIEPVRRWVRENGGAALAAWSAPDFILLHKTLREFHPDVTVTANAALRATVEPRMMTTPPKWGVTWPLTVAGLSDLDPEIACELMLSSGMDIRGALRYQVDEKFDDLAELSIRHFAGDSVNPIITQGLFARVTELANTGLSMPEGLQRAASFETRYGLDAFPATCALVVSVIDACGRITLREFLRWIEADLAPVLDAAREIAASSPGLLAFDVAELKKLGPLQRSLCWLSSDDRLSWMDLAYFSRCEAMPFAKVLDLAKGLTRYGIRIPDLGAPPKDILLTEAESALLDRCYDRYGKRVVNSKMSIFDYVSQSNTTIIDLITRLGVPDVLGKDSQIPSENLDRKQRVFVSRDLDGDTPFIRRITLSDLFYRACDSHFGSLADTVGVARSLADTGVDLGHILDDRILSLDDGLIAQFDAMQMTANAGSVVRRLFDAYHHSRSASVWDLALAATIGEIEPRALRPVLDLLEQCGGDVTRCREFLAFCAEA